jgi:tRNA (guanine26-N2/guanine27-N2)-dimethyltransferase
MEDIFNEGSAKILLPKSARLDRKMPVFYNPVMKHNRDLAILLLKSVPDLNLRVCLPLAGSGVRGIRFLKELSRSKIKKVYFNDGNPMAAKYIKRNLRINKIRSRFAVANTDANLFLRSHDLFDYIDVDPFGTPNPFLDAAIQRLNHSGILALTATDTAALCGSSPMACIRKYWAIPLHNHMMHEFGLRILIRKAQLVGAQYGRALLPIYSCSKIHYMRVFFRMKKAKSEVDKIMSLHGFYRHAGPMWLGPLWDSNLAASIAKQSYLVDHELARMLKTIASESSIKVIGFYDLHEFCKARRLEIPRNEELLKCLRKMKLAASPTHFSPYGIRTLASEKELVRAIKLSR